MNLSSNRPLIVGMGDCVVSREPGLVLSTCAIGSCVAVAAHDPQTRVGGILHFVLPNSQLNPAMAQAQPRIFGDTGLKDFLSELAAFGAQGGRLVFKLAGGASLLKDYAHQDIGAVNVETARKILEDRGFAVHGEDTGGNEIRTLRLDLESGRVTVRVREMVREI